MIQNCIFDLYGTLVDIHTDEEKKELWEKMTCLYRFYGADYEAGELEEAYHALVDARMLGEQLRKDAHEAYPEIQIEDVFEALYRQRGVSVSKMQAVMSGQFFRILSMDYLRLYPGTKDMLNSLRKAGIKCYILSNAQRIFTEYEIRSLGLEPYFDDIIISSDLACKKPDKRMFDHLLDKYRMDRSQTIMVGNDSICDIQGGKNAGLTTLYIHSNLSPDNDPSNGDINLEGMDMTEVKDKILSLCASVS